MRPTRIEPGPGQESVWDYPRPPALVPAGARIRVLHGGELVAVSTRAQRVLETSQPPAYYLPRADVTAALTANPTRTVCEWKGVASYWDVHAGGTTVVAAAWSYESPTAPFTAIAGHVAFYAQLLDECWVDDERVAPNPGAFYGGWITSRVVGPFKGAAGTLHW